MTARQTERLIAQGNDTPDTRPSQPGQSQNNTYDDHAAKLEYMREMLLEFCKLAHGLDENTLVYLLEVTVLEVDECAKAHRFKSKLSA